ncbi:MAG: hypothetical protein OFPII_39080 [Osedax symbiont Rs1]|nr:MAG: hypothetical protein OFPII_39080 [Osedax symbiont Rs1]
MTKIMASQSVSQSINTSMVVIINYRNIWREGRRLICGEINLL